MFLSRNSIVFFQTVPSMLCGMRPIITKVREALTTPPTRQDIAAVAKELIWLVPILGLCLILSEQMHWKPNFDTALLRLMIIAIVVPALGEELLFRVVMLPKPDPQTPLPAIRTVLALSLFVIWHPFQAFFVGDARAVIFCDPWFLVATAAMGFSCLRLYWRSGSIWSAIFMHWLIVIAWKSLAGGPALI